MNGDPLEFGLVGIGIGFGLSVVSPYVSPLAGTDVGLWGILFAVIGLVIVGVRVLVMIDK
jgi:hypothetical protein